MYGVYITCVFICNTNLIVRKKFHTCILHCEIFFQNAFSIQIIDTYVMCHCLILIAYHAANIIIIIENTLHFFFKRDRSGLFWFLRALKQDHSGIRECRKPVIRQVNNFRDHGIRKRLRSDYMINFTFSCCSKIVKSNRTFYTSIIDVQHGNCKSYGIR